MHWGPRGWCHRRAAGGRTYPLPPPSHASRAQVALKQARTTAPSQGFWQNQNGLCQWDALYPGNDGFKLGDVYYTKAQLRSIMAAGAGGSAINKLAFQLIPAKLGSRNYELGGCSVPDYIKADIVKADQIINDRVVPPVGDGRCACCPSSCGYWSWTVCADGNSCGRLDNGDVTTVASELDDWNQEICGFWQNQNGLCQWDALYPGNDGFKLGDVYYTKAQLRSIMAAGGGGSAINKLAFQLIPAKLGSRNYELGGCSVPDYIKADIIQADQIINDRVAPPVGDGKCDCCSYAFGCGIFTAFVCADGGSCGRLGNNDVTDVASELDDWNQEICV
ncbi:hypothetical protein COHA_002213 [Chlorella ohadii]|uniref:Uncharacterized protein n=1 Tax=Chlorella ohadii TaxID=2649997 RepID=A0AAD5H4K2_9CHLO|nr:hypothetical protein COHA_002213 [Chlorella ohadii]